MSAGRRAVVVLLLLALTTAGCTAGGSEPGGEGGPGGGVSTSEGNAPHLDPPELGACRVLTPSDVAKASDSTPTVPCSQSHTAQTFTVGSFPPAVLAAARQDGGGDSGYDSPALSRFILRECTDRFARFVGGDESRVVRSIVSWAWFRPPEQAWADGARWYRCDIVGGTTDAQRYRALPRTAQGLLSGVAPDAWTACVDGPSVTGSPWIPCTHEHVWRAVTTVQVAKDEKQWPGDRIMEARSRSYCSTSVGAWMNYSTNYAFAYTWFHEAEWDAGLRRTICWARTSQ